ncbi:SAM-dependent methyltransferase [Streptomyces sp. Z26]|uniref:SAM-dependent methyltransferase n=1 Tax=Streptomyces sp. Z26 TaxID=2500177 RepID=UPI001404D38D|nr:SAM-dependent methyltransferase [Streptomyces sp. Z26]
MTDHASHPHDPSPTGPAAGGGDPERASTARAYAGYLRPADGGAAPEGDLVAEVLAANPATQVSARENRRFVARAPAVLAGWGVTQFLDIGCGMPAEPSLHGAVQAVAPTARVVYVDRDPAVRARHDALGPGGPQGVVRTVVGDLRDPGALLDDPEVTAVLDLSRPVAVCTHAVFQFFRDDERDPRDVVRELMAPLAPGSFLSATHATPDFHPGRMRAALEVYHRHGVTGATLRTRDEFAGFFAGLELVEPGIVPVQRWRPDVPEADLPPDEDMGFWAAVARKP